MMAEIPAGFLEVLGEQRRHYVDSLPGKMADMDALWASIGVRAAPGDVEGMVRIAHGMAGSAAVFGFESLSAQARALVLELRALGVSGEKPAGERKATIAAALEHVRGCAAAAK